jgi:uncharacterized protein YndB with AHSA1/START domain
VSDDVATVERFIPALPEKIFAVIADASRHREFDGSGTVRDAHNDAPQLLSLGSRFGMAMRAGLPYSMVNTVVEFEPDRRIAWQPRPAYPLVDKVVGGRIWRYELEPVEGGTEVTESFDWSGALFPKGIELARYPERHPPAMERTLERLERVATGAEG